MKKISLFAVFAMISTAGFAVGNGGQGGPGEDGMGDPFANLTDTQRSCVTSCGVEIPEMPREVGQGMGPNTEKMYGEPSDDNPGVGVMTQMTETQKSCVTSCGVEMPENPGERTGYGPGKA